MTVWGEEEKRWSWRGAGAGAELSEQAFAGAWVAAGLVGLKLELRAGAEEL